MSALESCGESLEAATKGVEGSWWGKMATRESDIAAWKSGVQQIEDQDMALAARALPGQKPPGLLLTPFYAEAQLILPLPRLPLKPRLLGDTE